MSYIGNSPGVASQRVQSSFTATAGQQTFTPQAGYTLGYLDVYQNGVKLVVGDDYVAQDGLVFTLTTGALVGDAVESVAYFPRGLSDGYMKAEADARFPLLTDTTAAANAILYRNGSKLLSNNANFVFDGTNLGIGTSTPGAKLDVQGGSIAIGTTTAGNSTVGMVFGKVAANGGTIKNRISLATYGGSYGAYMEAFADLSATTATYLAFGTQAGGGGTPTERMRIDDSGRLLLNQTGANGSQYSILQMYENSTYGSSIEVRSGRAAAGNDRLYTTTLIQGSGANSGSSGNVAIKFHHNDNNNLTGDLSFWTKDALNTQYERMRIDYSGNVSIGSSALGKFAVKAGGNWRTGFGVGNSGTSPNAANLYYETDGSGWDFRIGKYQAGTFTPQMTFRDNGNIGVNTNDARSLFHIASSSSASVYTALTLQNTDNSSAGQGTQIVFKNSDYSATPETAKYGYIRYTAQSNYGEQGMFRIGTNNGYQSSPVDRLIISANGDTTLTTGTLYAPAAGAYAAITDLGWKARIQVATTDTVTTASRYIPIISGTSVSSIGYQQHTVFGAYRAGEWGSAFIAVGGNDNYPTRAFYFHYNGNFSADGTISGATKSFKIPHPLPELEETHNLVHISVEAPRADLIYRGKVNLVKGIATVNIDTASNMTEGTFVALCREVQCFTSNESGWNHVRGVVTGNSLTIECQDTTATDIISWMVVGERQDKHMFDTDTTDSDGNLITEPLRVTEDKPIEGYVYTPNSEQGTL